MSKRMLAIDPGTNCGYAWIDIASPVPPALKPISTQAGVWDLASQRYEGGGMRFVRARKYLTAIEPDFVLYEEVRSHKGVSAAHIYGGIVATIQSYCEERHIPYASIPVGTIKKRATGKGNCGKEPMIETANREFVAAGAEPIVDDNIADALWILQIGIEEYGSVINDGGKNAGS